MIKTLTMEIQEKKIDGITYIENEDSIVCNDCALKDEEDCCILIQGDEVTLCNLFSGHVLKIKED